MIKAQKPRNFKAFPLEALQGSIVDRFREIARRFPDRKAIQSKDRSMTYAELNRWSSAVASLVARHVVDDSPVAILLPQGPDFISGMFGVLALGVPYTPLDAAYPLERLKAIIEVGRPKVLLANTQTADLARDLAGTGCKVVLLEDVDLNAPIFESRANALSPAYLLFTSGSTGKPKGVLEANRNILHNVLRQTNSFFITPEDRQSLVYTCGVYGGARDIFCAILNGASLHHYDIETSGYLGIGDWLETSGITIYCSVATVFRYLSQYITDPKQVRTVRIIKLGGEASRRADLEVFNRLFSKNCLFYTGLASTETGTICQMPIAQDFVPANEILPLGKAVTGMEVLLLDKDGKGVPQGEVGEITVRSDFLSLGYYQLPEQTNAKFFVHEGRRSYHMGDLGRFDEEGCLWHCGRADQQVKVRGNRIELSDIENALLKQGKIADTVVMAAPDKNGENRIITYIVPKEGSGLRTEDVRRALRETLPAFMIPSRIILVKEFPRTVNGKVDRPKLPDPDTVATESKADGNDPKGYWTVTLVDIWKRLLNVDAVRIDDNFFELGGHSLRTVQMLDEVNLRVENRISVSKFLEKPTIRHIVELIRASEAPKPEPIVTFARGKPGSDAVLLVPGVGGFVMTLRLLGECLKSDRTVIAAQICEEELAILEDMRKLAVSVVDKAMPHLSDCRDLHLVGYSFGGGLAVEIAQEFERRGRKIANVFVVDTDPPFSRIDEWQLLTPIVIPGLEKPVQGTFAAVVARSYHATRKAKAGWSVPLDVNIRGVLISSMREHPERQKAQKEQWKRVLPGLQVAEIDSPHVKMMEKPHVDALAALIEKFIASGRTGAVQKKAA